MSTVFQHGDPVWSKMRGYSPWPSRIAKPTRPEHMNAPKKNIPIQFVYFFGTGDYAWLEETKLTHFEEKKEEYRNGCKSASFKAGLEQIDEYIQDPEKFLAVERSALPDHDADFNKLKEESDDNVSEKSSKKEKRKSTDLPSRVPTSTKKARASSETKKAKKTYPSIKRERTSSFTKRRSGSSEMPSLNHAYSKKSGSLLERPANIARPDTPPLDLETVSNTLRGKNIQASTMKFGFLGLGIMGSGIVKNLLNSGHKVVIWNRTLSKCKEFEKIGAMIAPTPCDVIEEADITFSCVADPQAAKEMVFGNCGVLHCPSLSQKGYVEMTSVDAETSQDIVEALSDKGARFLEAQLQGSKYQAEEGNLIILAAGERTLFDDCQTCFKAISKNSFYLGEVGNASKMNLVLQLVGGVALAGLAEGLALADRAGLSQHDLLEVLSLTSLACPHLMDKGKSMVDAKYGTCQPLTHMQKDLKLALSMGDSLEQSLPLTATTNEIFKHAKRLGYSNHDVSAVYIRAKF